ncbi:MAG: hypothetical protein QNJ53_28620 [Pleurocapsa sp. MO_192.B19]|nr:hypothetical protein [Pleurocapsa sp. MO_192.B19]
MSLSRLIPTLASLKKRSLIEVISEENKISFTLQPMIMKYLLTEHKDLFDFSRKRCDERAVHNPGMKIEEVTNLRCFRFYFQARSKEI